MLDFKIIEASFAARGFGKEVSEYELAYQELRKRVELVCRADPDGDWGDARRIKRFSLVLRQVQLHRAIILFEGSFTALLADNVYLMTLAMRGYYESVGVLGYLYNRLKSWSQGSIEGEKVDEDIGILLLGGREGGIPKAPEAKQILSMLEDADRSISKNILGGTAKQYNMLSESYKFLCEFSHPNFHSNSVALRLDRPNKQFIIRYDEMMNEAEYKLIEYLLIATELFVRLFDEIEVLVLIQEE
jgi:hypothetical protein